MDDTRLNDFAPTSRWSGGSTLFTERRWERQHMIGWLCIVVESHAQWYTAWGQPPGRSQPTPALQGDDLAKCQDAAERQIPPHACDCPPWREIVRQRSWPRKQLRDPLLAHIGEQPARVLDLSYGGFRLEVAHADFPARFQIAFRGLGVRIEARAIWTRPAPAGLWWCGAEVCDPRTTAETGWRQLVESVYERL